MRTKGGRRVIIMGRIKRWGEKEKRSGRLQVKGGGKCEKGLATLAFSAANF